MSEGEKPSAHAASPCTPPRPRRSASAQLAIALTAISPHRRRRARLDRQGAPGPVQLPFDVLARISEFVRLADGGGAIDRSLMWATRGYLSPFNSSEDLVAGAWRITELLTAAGLMSSGAYNIRAVRRDAVKRRPLLEARAADLLNLRLVSREWADAARPVRARRPPCR